VDSTVLGEIIRVEDGVMLEGSTLGSNVTIEAGARILDSSIRNCIIGPGAVIESSVLHDSLIGGHSMIRGFNGKLSVADHSVVRG
jgi:carbonic anhydrase/acetyltransferase-like protein (isoleucine patch superfamily)